MLNPAMAFQILLFFNINTYYALGKFVPTVAVKRNDVLTEVAFAETPTPNVGYIMVYDDDNNLKKSFLTIAGMFNQIEGNQYGPTKVVKCFQDSQGNTHLYANQSGAIPFDANLYPESLNRFVCHDQNGGYIPCEPERTRRVHWDWRSTEYPVTGARNVKRYLSAPRVYENETGVYLISEANSVQHLTANVLYGPVNRVTLLTSPVTQLIFGSELSISADLFVTVNDTESNLLEYKVFRYGTSVCRYIGYICCPTRNYLCKAYFSGYIKYLLILVACIICVSYLYPVLLTIALSIRFLRWFKRRVIPGKKGISKGMKLMALASVMNGMKIEACSEVSVISSTNSDCIQSGSTRMCEFHLHGILSIQHVYESACLNFKDPEGFDMSELQITYSHFDYVIGARSLYYTTRWEGYSTSIKRCYMAGGCPDSCDSIDVNDPTLSSEVISNPLLEWPGESSCSRTCGCAGCGCLLCDSACLFSRFSVMPRGSTIQVFEPILLTPQPWINIQYKNYSVTTKISGDPVVVGPFSITLVGNFDSSVGVFGDNKFITSQGDWYYGPANNLGEFDTGRIGDVQASHPISLVEPSVSEFKFGQNFAVPTQEGSWMKYTFPSVGASTIFDLPILPTNIGQGSVSRIGSSLLFSVPNSPAIEILITAPAGLKLTVDTTKVCLIFSIINGTGCYNCGQGFTLVIRARGTCGYGTARISLTDDVCFSGYSTAINVHSTDVEIKLPLTAQCAAISGTISSNDLDVTQQRIHFQFTAEQYTPNLNPDQPNTTIIPSKVLKDVWGWFDWFHFPNSQILSIALFLLGFVLLLIILYRLFIRLRVGRKQKRM